MDHVIGDVTGEHCGKWVSSPFLCGSEVTSVANKAAIAIVMLALGRKYTDDVDQQPFIRLVR